MRYQVLPFLHIRAYPHLQTSLFYLSHTGCLHCPCKTFFSLFSFFFFFFLLVLPLRGCLQYPCQTRAWVGVGQAQTQGVAGPRHLRRGSWDMMTCPHGSRCIPVGEDMASLLASYSLLCSIKITSRACDWKTQLFQVWVQALVWSTEMPRLWLPAPSVPQSAAATAESASELPSSGHTCYPA